MGKVDLNNIDREDQVRMTIDFPRDLRERTENMAKLFGVSLRSVVMVALDCWLNNTTRELKRKPKKTPKVDLILQDERH